MMSKITIRDVAAGDNQSLIELVHATLGEFGAKSGDGFAMDDAELLDMYKSYQLPGTHYFVIEKDGNVLGGAGVAPLDGEDNPTIC
jgi:putative acetyltransferase